MAERPSQGRYVDPGHTTDDIDAKGSMSGMHDAQLYILASVASSCLLLGIVIACCYYNIRMRSVVAKIRHMTDASAQTNNPPVNHHVRPRGLPPAIITVEHPFCTDSQYASFKTSPAASTNVNDSSPCCSPEMSPFYAIPPFVPNLYEDTPEEETTLLSFNSSVAESVCCEKAIDVAHGRLDSTSEAKSLAEYPSMNYDIHLMDLHLRNLGEGAFGHVTEAFYLKDDGEVLHVAAKYAHDASIASSNSFEKELEIAANLPRQQNVVQYYGGRLYKQTSKENKNKDDDCFIVMELMFTNLQSLIHGDILPGEMNFSLILSISLDIAKGLDHLHEHGIIHYDLKPSNVLLDENFSAKLADFGSSKRKLGSLVTGTLRGTVGYIAPEVWFCQYVNRAMVTKKLDIFSLGVCMWEMVTGESPPEPRSSFSSSFQGSLTRSVEIKPRVLSQRSFVHASKQRCPPALRALIEDCVSLEANLRPTTKEVKRRIMEIQSGM